MANCRRICLLCSTAEDCKTALKIEPICTRNLLRMAKFKSTLVPKGVKSPLNTVENTLSMLFEQSVDLSIHTEMVILLGPQPSQGYEGRLPEETGEALEVVI